MWRDKWLSFILSFDEQFDNDRFLDAVGRMAWSQFGTGLWER
jgi:hypothetical protein